MGAVYKHKYFKLSEDSREVLDEFGRKVSITGNNYMLLLFLCKQKNATATDINDFIDRAANLNEENIRQYRYKIKLALGHDVINYSNHIYSIDGEVSELKDGQLQQESIYKTANDSVNKKLIKNTNKNRFKIILGGLIILALVGILLFILARQYRNTIKPKNEMVLIPTGEFIMGSTEEKALMAYKLCQEQNQCVKEDYLDEYPEHTVSVSNFYIDKKEVSNADYRMFTRATGHTRPQYWDNSNLNQDSQPVVGVNWYDANSYCEWFGKRLPTEVEMEKAARSSDGRIYPWGNSWDGSKVNHGKGGNPGLDDSDGFLYTAPVGNELGVSPYGVLDMAGNVWEWTADTFNQYQGNDKYSHSRYNQGLKVVKGGAYDTDPTTQRTATRYYYNPNDVDIDLGFRCATN